MQAQTGGQSEGTQDLQFPLLLASGPEHPVCNINVYITHICIENVFRFMFFTENEPKPLSLSLKKLLIV